MKCSGVYPHSILQPCSFCQSVAEQKLRLLSAQYAAAKARREFEQDLLRRRLKRHPVKAALANVLEAVALRLLRFAKALINDA